MYADRPGTAQGVIDLHKGHIVYAKRSINAASACTPACHPARAQSLRAGCIAGQPRTAAFRTSALPVRCSLKHAHAVVELATKQALGQPLRLDHCQLQRVAREAGVQVGVDGPARARGAPPGRGRARSRQDAPPPGRGRARSRQGAPPPGCGRARSRQGAPPPGRGRARSRQDAPPGHGRARSGQDEPPGSSRQRQQQKQEQCRRCGHCLKGGA
eukprot:327534-Chlamydomonas_euryale.AAC.4